MRFANDKEYLKDLTEDTFLRGFLSELYNRPSCHDCKCRELKSGSDLTIADYWRVHEKFPEMDDDRGASLVLVNTSKGETIWSNISNIADVSLSDFADAIRTNPAIVRSSPSNRNRGRFFKDLDKKDFDCLVISLVKRPLLRRMASHVKRLLRMVVKK